MELTFLFLLCCFSLKIAASTRHGSVVLVKNGVNGDYGLKYYDRYVAGAAAVGNFTDDINKTGWSFLDISTDAGADDMTQAYSAGVLESHLTRIRIAQHWNNTMRDYCKKPYTGYCTRLQSFLINNTNWIQQQIKQNQNDSFWHQIALIYSQINGIIDGFMNKTGKPRTTIDDPLGLFLFYIGGDTEDLEPALKKPNLKRILGSGSCSALIKLLPGNSDLLVAQDTWNGYESMLRIIKRYHFSYRLNSDPKSGSVASKMISFSSYPGAVFSGDDFYITDAGLVTQETTNGNNNDKLWSKITPNSVLENFRSMAANRLGNSGKTWVSTFSRYNSGTYNNQWMIVDYKLFTPQEQTLKPGLLYVAEQIPGKITSGDLTKVLKQQTYWASYNIPYFTDIFKESGYPRMAWKYGEWFTHEGSPRAKIFKRDHVKVTDLTSMTTLMRYNDFKNDPLSKCKCNPPYSAENAISARSDLNPANGTYPFGALGHRKHGGTDMKLTSYSLSKKMRFLSVCGPTSDTQPPFQWSKSDYKAVPHEGHPDLFKFPPVLHDWATAP
ncbi:putative phospholipase B-like 2 [Tubulanus polymorphus]|uniref:putative phospholipase B-like 2 n=1 Tax=Tubulanus polymorphus TaxID=672921 RepID=UPI003DA63F8C